MILRNKILLAASQKSILHNLLYPNGDCEIDSDSNGLVNGIIRDGGARKPTVYFANASYTGNHSQGFKGDGEYGRVYFRYNVTEAGLYYVCLCAKYVSAGTMRARCRKNANIDAPTEALFNAIITSDWALYSATSVLAVSDYINFGLYSVDPAADGLLDTAMVFNLTKDIGDGKEPTKDQMDAFIQAQPDYFEKRIYVPGA